MQVCAWVQHANHSATELSWHLVLDKNWTNGVRCWSWFCAGLTTSCVSSCWTRIATTWPTATTSSSHSLFALIIPSSPPPSYYCSISAATLPFHLPFQRFLVVLPFTVFVTLSCSCLLCSSSRAFPSLWPVLSYALPLVVFSYLLYVPNHLILHISATLSFLSSSFFSARALSCFISCDFAFFCKLFVPFSLLLTVVVTPSCSCSSFFWIFIFLLIESSSHSVSCLRTICSSSRGWEMTTTTTTLLKPTTRYCRSLEILLTARR